MTRSPLEAATDALALVWEAYDRQCLKRTIVVGTDPTTGREKYRTDSKVPTTEVTLRMERAVARLGELVGQNPTRMRTMLVAQMKDGTSHRGAIALTLKTLDTRT